MGDMLAWWNFEAVREVGKIGEKGALIRCEEIGMSLMSPAHSDFHSVLSSSCQIFREGSNAIR